MGSGGWDLSHGMKIWGLGGVTHPTGQKFGFLGVLFTSSVKNTGSGGVTWGQGGGKTPNPAVFPRQLPAVVVPAAADVPHVPHGRAPRLPPRAAPPGPPRAAPAPAADPAGTAAPEL